MLRLQVMQAVDRETRATAQDFEIIDHHLGPQSKCQARHGQTVCRIGQWTRLVPRLACGQDVHLVQVQLADRGLDQGHMRHVGRVKSTAKNAQTPHAGFGLGRQDLPIQTQSLGCKKWLSKSASGEPTGSWRW